MGEFDTIVREFLPKQPFLMSQGI